MKITLFRTTCLLMSLWAMPPLVVATPADEKYREAVKLAKQGHHAKAILMLDQLVSRHPGHLKYRYDYILTLSWSGKDREALQVSRKLDPKQTPPYVLEAIGKSARNEQDYELAQKMYRYALQKHPDRLQSQLGLSYVLLESGQSEEPMAMLLTLAERNPKHIATLEALAIAHQQNKEYFKALSLYQKILKLKPEHRSAKRGLTLIASQLGVPHVAMKIIEKNPGLVNDNELSRIRQDRAAIGIRWGQLYKPIQGSRFDDTDTALKELQALLNHLEERGEKNSAQVHGIKTDMLIVLFDRNRIKECIALFEELKRENVDIADYGLMAIARAYQSEGQPEKARDIYLQVLKNKPDDFEARLGLFYAYIEIPDQKQALTLANDLANSEVEWVDYNVPPYRRVNPNKVAADVIQALALAWTDNLSDAQHRFDALVKEAPFNAGLRADRGYVYLWRGWPIRALQEFRLAHDIDNEALTPLVGEVEALFNRRNYHRTESVLQDMTRQYPDEERVAKQQRSWFVHNLREFYLEISGSDNATAQPGSRSLKLDAWQYTSPINKNYRYFVHEVGDFGKFTEGSESYFRLGGGVEYRTPNWQASGELSSGEGDYSDFGIGISANWTPDDIWSTSLALNSYSNDIPLRGRLNEGVKGADVKLDVVYRFHESRQFSVVAQYIDMSDGNERVSLGADYSQRLTTRPGYKLDGSLGLYSSKNSRVNASYFNPENDFSASITLNNEWLLSRNKKREFLHRLGGSIGAYTQKSFGSDGLWSISYEHQWVIGDKFVLKYGIARSQHPYDGVQDSENQFTFMTDWRF